MPDRIIDLDTWPRAAQYRLFRTYDRPQYAITTRIDVTALMERRKRDGISPYRATCHAIGEGIHAVPELRTRFQGETVTEFAQIELSMTVPVGEGDFRYGYVTHDSDFARFEANFEAASEAARTGAFVANTGERVDLAYLSCLPWMDYTSLDNALPGPDDCIPRIGWGKIVPSATGGQEMAMTLQCHHALVDGYQCGVFFDRVRQVLAA
ncbi:CatA-like O-acetyltransferase [Pelagovum pacificum]|uniref:Chloramphenicol acetyltransferase n=1 Tax=Pelagovum pacificum TaxID=2588711 RepID=A0A5C5G8Y6_9RHOB|nr:CatA-like O-acetyltransferase [Pelagovum pacificum]QQA42087.1 chloramphenicol acetyltransferase [Pelagovum pacificum]TNY31175.1 chloramphenicol acetyltransferase [Pelagovum pacificum]